MVSKYSERGSVLIIELIILAVILAVGATVGYKAVSRHGKAPITVTPPPITAPPPPATSHNPTPPPAPAPGTVVTVTDADNGKTIQLDKLQSLTLELGSTYWQIKGSSDSRIIYMVGDPIYRPVFGGIPGTGNGTVTAMFSPKAPGTATISASRTSCGEALQCTGSQGKFQVTVITSALK